VAKKSQELTGSYSQELKRTMKLFSSFAVAFSFISVTTGIFTNFGFVLQTTGPVGIWMWPIVGIGHLIVAIIFAELAGRIPLSGYSYQWVSRLANLGTGWFAGWIAMIFLIIVVPAIDYGLAPIIAQLFGWEASPRLLGSIVVVILLTQAAINIFGVKLATRLNDIAVYTEVLGMVGIILLLGVMVTLSGKANWSLLSTVSHSLTQSGGSYLGSFLLAGLMGAFTLVGFEAAANLSEETIDAQKNVPKAMILSIILSGGIGMIFLIVISVSIGNLSIVTNSTSPVSEILKSHLGSNVAAIFLVFVLVSIFACGLISMASASRLIYAMARDNVFVASSFFRKITKNGVPSNAIILVLVLGILAVVFSDSLTLLVGAASVLPAVLYLITILAYAYKQKDLPKVDSFNLGKWRKPLTIASIIWLAVELSILTIPSQFHQVALVTVIIMMVGVLVYLLFYKKGICEGRIGMKINEDNSYILTSSKTAVDFKIEQSN
jgi:amino acid transporter